MERENERREDVELTAERSSSSTPFSLIRRREEGVQEAKRPAERSVGEGRSFLRGSSWWSKGRRAPTATCELRLPFRNQIVRQLLLFSTCLLTSSLRGKAGPNNFFTELLRRRMRPKREREQGGELGSLLARGKKVSSSVPPPTFSISFWSVSVVIK